MGELERQQQEEFLQGHNDESILYSNSSARLDRSLQTGRVPLPHEITEEDDGAMIREGTCADEKELVGELEPVGDAADTVDACGAPQLQGHALGAASTAEQKPAKKT